MTKGENIVFGSIINRKILIYLNKKVSDYPMNVARQIKDYPSGVLNKLKELKENGLIEKADDKMSKKGPSIKEDVRRKYFKLTDKGKRISELLLHINKEVKTK